MRYYLITTLLLCLLATMALAAPGILSGKVILEDTKDGATGASVSVLELNNVGTKVDLDGNYKILNLTPGTYSVKYSMIGYAAVTVKSIVIESGKTFTQNVSLKPTSVQNSEIEVRAERPSVTLSAPSADKSVSGVIGKQGAVKIDKEGQIHVRGGRGNETAYLTDGADVRDPVSSTRTNIQLKNNAPGVMSGSIQADQKMSAPGMYAPTPPPYYPNEGRDSYAKIVENSFTTVKEEPLSTFSIDVDAASYSNIRSFIMNYRQRPPVDAVRIEEMINYFSYQYPEPHGKDPCSITTNLTECPWAPEHHLLRVGLKARSVDLEEAPPNNLVFLVDVSGSMGEPNKLPLVKRAFKLLADQMRGIDRVSIVTYAGYTGVALPSTSGNHKDRIKEVIDQLGAGGSTAGASGIELAYKIAKENFNKGANNRIILATDGDFNVGVSNNEALVQMIEEKRKTGIFFSILGFGRGNLQDDKMEALADKGNGQYFYIDNFQEAKRIFVNQLSGTLLTVAKDVKVQIEFNPTKVQGYRLLGYENRMLKQEDFNNDKIDAGEMGAGHTVTALYEIVPVGSSDPTAEVDPLRYQPNRAIKDNPKSEIASDEWMFVKVRYKEPDGNVSKLVTKTVTGKPADMESTSDDMRFATAVAEFGMLLRSSGKCGNIGFEDALALAKKGSKVDPDGYRAELIQMIESMQYVGGNR